MDLLTYIVIAFVYIMVIHFAISVGDFNLFLMLGIFVFCGVLGAYLHTYEFGLGAAVVLSLIFW